MMFQLQDWDTKTPFVEYNETHDDLCILETISNIGLDFTQIHLMFIYNDSIQEDQNQFKFYNPVEYFNLLPP